MPLEFKQIPSAAVQRRGLQREDTETPGLGHCPHAETKVAHPCVELWRRNVRFKMYFENCIYRLVAGLPVRRKNEAV